MESSRQHLPSHKLYLSCLLILTLWMSLFGISNLPVIDRDEARYAQATVQMVETDDYLNIRFQDRARNKKPAGIYWMQAASVKAFTDPGERKIWAHRIPSVLGAILAVFATYWGTLAVLGRREAFIAGAVLATSALFVFEAHIAKTDAMLCGFSALALAAMLRLRVNLDKWAPLLFWVAIGGAIMIKGPITPALIILTLICLAVWERDLGWMRRLFSWPGILMALLIVLPWSIAIGIETNGAFFKDAIGGDLAPKLAGGQEKHGAPPGYYLGTLPILFWPACLFLIAGMWTGLKQSRSSDEAGNKEALTARLLLCWIVPFWLLLEIVPTKLPNYLLPIYPALAILCAVAISKMIKQQNYKWSRWLGGVLILIVTGVLVAAIVTTENFYSVPSTITRGFVSMGAALAMAAAFFFWRKEALKALIAAIMSTVIMTPLVYQHVLPRSQTLLISPRIQNAFENNRIILPRHSGPRILSPHFTEPSLVFHLGTDIVLGDKIETILAGKLLKSDIILLDEKNERFTTDFELISQKYNGSNLCLRPLSSVDGINYSKGDDVKITIFETGDCD